MRTVSTPFTRETVSFSRTAARPSGPDGDFGPTDSMATLPLLESCRKARLKRPVELRCSVACTRDEDSLAAPGAGSSAPGSIGAVDSIAGYEALKREDEFLLEIPQNEIEARISLVELSQGKAASQGQRDQIEALYLEEQMLVREALALNLDRDARIHDMLAQKMRHVLSGDWRLKVLTQKRWSYKYSDQSLDSKCPECTSPVSNINKIPTN